MLIPDRRAVLRGGLLIGSLSLVGCGVRLEDDAPDVPLVPTREPVPGETVLLTVLASLASGSGEHDAARADALEDALTAAEVPAEDIAAARARGPVGRADQVTAHEAAVTDCPASMLPLTTSLLAGRMLDGDLPEDYWTPAGEDVWTVTAPAAEALAATRAADYAMAVVLAKGGDQLTKRTEATRDVLAGLVARQVTAAADDGTDDALGYDLGGEVRSRAEAAELAKGTLERLVDGYVAVLPGLSEDRAGAREVAGWVAQAQVRARTWGADDPDLPGMQV